MFFVYILYSPNHDRYYIGQTNNLESRIIRHQRGYVKSTKGYRPIHLEYYKEYATRSESMRRENYLKSLKSKEALKELIDTSR